jgi:anti-sigma factor RsiW
MSMNCQAVEKDLIAYLDGRADPSRRCEIEAHLAECGACREHARQLRELWGILDESPALPPSPGFDAALRARIAQEPHRWGVWGWLAAPSPRLAIGVTALLVFSIWLSSLPRAAQPPPRVSSAVEAEFSMIADLPVLEDYDVLANFEALSELPVQAAIKQPPGM